jgi:hypothetical protein
MRLPQNRSRSLALLLFAAVYLAAMGLIIAPKGFFLSSPQVMEAGVAP